MYCIIIYFQLCFDDQFLGILCHVFSKAERKKGLISKDKEPP